MANGVNFIRALAIASELISDAVSINAVHDEARFTEVKKDFMQLSATIGALFPGDPIVSAVLKAAAAGVDTLTWQDFHKEQASGEVFPL